MDNNPFFFRDMLFTCLRFDRYYLFKLLFAIALYTFSSRYVLNYFAPNDIVSIFYIASGVGLAIVLIGGTRYALSIFFGQTLSAILLGLPCATAMGMGVGCMLGAITGVSLLRHKTSFDLSLTSISDWLRLVMWGGFFACSINAIAGASSLLLGGFISLENYPDKIVNWWMGDLLGVIVITPFVLTWWNARYSSMTLKQLAEALLIIGLNYLVGQAIFLGWFHGAVGQIAYAYWMFLLIIWVAVRLDTHWVTLVIVIASIQALQGIYSESGIFNTVFALNKALNYWCFIIVFSVVGMTLSTFITTLKRTKIAQQEALECLQKIASRVPGMVFQFRLSVDGHYSTPYSSDGIHDVFRLSPEDVRENAAVVFTRVHPDDYDFFLNSIQESALNLTNWLCEFRVQFDDGAIRYLESNAIPQREQDGSTLWHGYIADITQRKDNEQQLRTLAVAIEQSPTSIVITDLEADLLYVNPKFTEVTGYSIEEAIGQNPRLLHSGFTPKAVYVELWDTLLQGKVWHGELINQRKNGEIYWEDAHIAPAKDSFGITTHYVGVKIEITERKLMEEKIHFLFDFSPIGFALNDFATGQFIEINEAMFKGTGYSKREFLDLSYWDLTPREYEAQEQQQLESLRTTGRYGPYEKEYIRKDGSRYPVLLNGMLMHDVKGHELIWSIVENITERKQAEEALRRSETKLSTLYNSTSEAVMLLDERGFFDCNKATLNMFGCATNEEFFSKHPADVSPPLQPCGTNSLILAEQRIATAMKNGSFQFEWMHKRVDTGENFPAEVLLCPMILDGKQVLQAAVRDITERKRIENQLRETERKFRQLIEKAPIPLEFVNNTQEIEYVNNRFTEVFGYTLEDIPTLDTCRLQMYPDKHYRQWVDETWQMAVVHSIIENTDIKPVEYQVTCKDGSIRTMQTSGIVFLEGCLTIFIDVTERKQVENALRESEERYRKVSEASSDYTFAGCITDAGEVRHEWATKAFTRITGLSDDNTAPEVWKNFLQHIYEPDKSNVAKQFQQFLNNKAMDCDFRFVRPDGELRWLNLSAKPTWDVSENRVTYIWGAVKDISKRKQAENLLRQSEIKLSTLYNSNSDALMLLDERGFFDCNRATLEIFGCETPEDILFKHPADVSPPVQACGTNSRILAEQRIATAMKNGSLRFEWIHKRVDTGKTFPAEVLLCTMILEGKMVLHVVVRNITERKSTEERLRQSEAQFRNTFEYAPIGVMNISLDSRFMAVNQTFCDLFGYTREELLTMSILDMIQDQDKEFCTQLMQSLLTKERTDFSLERQCVHKNGLLIWANLRMRFNYQADGSPDYFIATIANIDERVRIQNEILATKNQLQATLEAIPDTLFEIDAKGYFYNYYAPHKKLLIAPEQFMGKTVTDVLPVEASEVIMMALNEALKQGWSTGKQFKLDMPEGNFWFELSTSNKHAELGEEPHFIVLSRDITERKHAEIELRIAATVFESQEGMLITDVDGFILKVNQAFTRITGYSAAEAIGQKPSILRSGRHDATFYSVIWQSLENTGAWRGEIWNRRKNGQIYPEWLTITAVSGNKETVTHYVATLTDITERKEAEESINQLAFYDPLTQLPNRRLLRERMKHGIEVSHRTGTQMAVLLMDLDNFKAVNDTLGHTAGDELLQQVAERIKARLRDVDMVARLGGDEFVVLIEDIGHYEVVARIAEDIIESLSQVFTLGKNHEAHIGTSIGISIYPEHGDCIEALMDNADAALYHAKDNGRGCFAYFSEQLTQQAHERIALEVRLRRAIKQNELQIYWQPQIEISTGQIVGAEALIRWHDTVNGHILPKDFIPLAEETGLIVTMGEWVLRETCKQGKQWLDQGLMPVTLAVNVSPYQFRRCDINVLITLILNETGFPAKYLELEITETGLMENQEQALSILNNLHDQGVRIAIDDFGTGYSSLAYLKYFPLDILKIDKTFIDDIPFSENDMAITSTIISMAHHLGFKVLAEGVETHEQLAFLQEQDCDRYQGYFYNEALSSSDFFELLSKQNTGDQVV